MTKFMDEVRDLHAHNLNEKQTICIPIMRWELKKITEKLIAIDDLCEKWSKGHTEEECCAEQIRQILEGEQK